MRFISIAALILALAPASFAQGAAERAAALKQWKADCSQEDPDLRLAYIEDAIVNQGATVARLCARQALESKDPDTRALGLRAALAMTDVLNLPFEMPIDYQKALAAAKEDDAEAVKEVQGDYSSTLYYHREFGSSFAFKQKKVELEKATTEWISKDRSGNFDPDNEARITSTAESIRIEGNISNRSITIDLQLKSGGVLVGTAVLDGKGPYPVVAEIL